VKTLPTSADFVLVAPVFDVVTEMEDDLEAATSFCAAIALITETMNDSHASAPIQRLAWEIKNRVALAEEKRCKLFKLTHPDRQRFEREGWPGLAENSDAAA